jgi:hypothetical protein
VNREWKARAVYHSRPFQGYAAKSEKGGFPQATNQNQATSERRKISAEILERPAANSGLTICKVNL